MFKRTTGYIIALILVISLLAGCGGSSGNITGPSDNPTAGFEISNLRYKVTKTGGQGVGATVNNITVDYKGAEEGIKEVVANGGISG